MKDKDFRTRLLYLLEQDASCKECADRILALCKEMLVPAEKSVKYLHRGNDGSKQIGWNACRSELLKQLGEK